MPKRTIIKDAGTGRFASREEERARPETTYRQAVHPDDAAFVRAVLEFCEAAHSALVLSPDVSRGDKGRLDATIKELRSAVRREAR